ncbi:hypothetical protein WN943_024047 [Citrus x changshan-huyou]
MTWRKPPTWRDMMDGVEKAAFRGDEGADEVNNKTSQRERSNDSTASEAASGRRWNSR